MYKLNKKEILSNNLYDDVTEYLQRTSYSTGEFSKEEIVEKTIDDWYQIDLSDEFGTTD